MLIECPDCDAKVHGKLIAEKVFEYYDRESERFVFLECPGCHKPLLGRSDYIEFETEDGFDSGWTTNLVRLYPQPHKKLDPLIPHQVIQSLEDARKCYQAKVYTASAVMCGRALEAICKEKTGESTLAKGLKSLKSQNLIDNRLFDWGDALRKERNIGAHASDETVTRTDARDILDFANAIVEYIYVMTAKYEAYQDRKTKRAANAPKTT
jgi:hypothetical protein